MIAPALCATRSGARPPGRQGGSGDFYWFESDNVTRTPESLAMEQAIASGYRGTRWRYWRPNTPNTANGELPDKAWVILAYTHILDTLGDTGTLVQPVADATILEDVDYTTEAYQISDSVFDGLAAASATPEIVFQVGNEPYIGATGSGTHAELNATYAARCLEVAQGILALHPTAKFCGPSIGTFRETTLAACKSQLDTNWALVQSLFAGHGIFTYWGANIYRWDHSPVLDTSDAGFVYGARALRANAALLGCSPIVTEIGLKNPTAAALDTAMRMAGSDLPQILWKVGPGDDYDMIASGAIEVPTV